MLRYGVSPLVVITNSGALAPTVRRATTNYEKATTSRNTADILDRSRDRPRHHALVQSVQPRYWISMLWSIDTCQNKVSRDHIVWSGLDLLKVT